MFARPHFVMLAAFVLCTPVGVGGTLQLPNMSHVRLGRTASTAAGARLVSDATPQPESAPPPREVLPDNDRNWRVYRHDELVVLTGGEGYLGNQLMNIYLMPPSGILGSFMVSGTKLAPNQAKALVRTDAGGNLPRTVIGRLPPGLHILVADYNGDGEYTDGLDAYTVVSVKVASEAPPPRAVEDSRCYQTYFKEWSLEPGQTSDTNSLLVQWRVRVNVRRTVSTGKDLIDFHWGIKYSGRRNPLIMLRPSLTDTFPGATKVEFYAFPPGEQKGRIIAFTATEEPSKFARANWFLEVDGGKWETGTITVPVADLKEALRSNYPTEFPANQPPKLYAQLRHKAALREMDAWTGVLESKDLEITDLNKW